MNKERMPRVLIISRNALKTSGSNGKVLGELFAEWDSDCLAQFYTYNELPDYSRCHNYFRVTDGEAVKSLLPWKTVGGKVDNDSSVFGEVALKGGKTVGKSPLTLLMQDMVWNTGCWKSNAFKKWIDDFSPEVLFIMAGASSFMHRIAIHLSKKRQIPIVLFNTENYYLKGYNYLSRYGWRWLYPIYKRECDRMFERLMEVSSHEIYNNDKLDELYYKRFGRHGSVIYQASSFTPFTNHEPHTKEQLRFSYAGNLGVNRHKALIEIGSALQDISKDYRLDVYGPASDAVAEELNRAAGIVFHGLVPYAKVIEVMEQSDFMVHAESFDEFWVKDLCTAFSTKLSDILTTGSCLILYAHESLACSKYVAENQCGCLIKDKTKLKEEIESLINHPEKQAMYRANAVKASMRDMDKEKNCEKLKDIIIGVIINRV